MTNETAPEAIKNRNKNKPQDIKGWGIDADPENDPTYPMKARTNEEHQGYAWERPPLQEPHIEVLKSVERPNVTAVFGATVPPSGLSGAIRRQAFKCSESSYGRWVPLIVADRINIVEGLLDDLRRGYFPNLFAERGLKSEWKHNRGKFLLRTAATTAVAGALAIWFFSRRENSAR